MVQLRMLTNKLSRQFIVYELLFDVGYLFCRYRSTWYCSWRIAKYAWRQCCHS